MAIILFEIFLIGISLSMDALAVSVTDGLCYRNLTKRKGASIPLTFGIFQAAMPLIGFFIAYAFGLAFQKIFDTFDHWLAFGLLCMIGGKMLLDAIKGFRSGEEEVNENNKEVDGEKIEANEKKFSILEVLLQGVATSIDALFVGVSFMAYDKLKNSIPLLLISVSIIGVVTFCISLVGLILGVKFGNILKKKEGIAQIIGGLVLIAIGLKILIQGLI